jgi:SAM-dependent methyltransferase
MKVNQQEYYDKRYIEFLHPFPRIYYEIRYLLVKKVVMKKIKSHFHTSQGLNVLDVGCGIGEWGLFFEENLFNYAGIDISISAIKYANEHFGLDCRLGSIKDLDTLFQEKKFDIIFFSEVFEHLDREQKKDALLKIKDKLNESGLLIITCPNPEFYSLLSTSDFHEEELSKKEIEQLMKDSNYNYIIEFLGGYFTAWLDGRQGLFFPNVVTRERLKFVRLGSKNALYVLILPLLVRICQVEKFLVNAFSGNGYHFLITARSNQLSQLENKKSI